MIKDCSNQQIDKRMYQDKINKQKKKHKKDRYWQIFFLKKK